MAHNLKNALKKGLLVSFVLSLALFSAGCSRQTPTGSTGSGKKEIFVWRQTEYKDLFGPYAGQFMANNKNVQLWYTQQNPENYEGRTINQIATDVKPQVWSIPVDWLPDHLDKLVPMPAGILGEDVDNVDFMKNKLLTGANNDIHKNIIFGNKVYALPFTIDSLVLYYNQDLFDAAFDRWQAAHPRADKSEPSAEEIRVNKLLKTPPTTWQELLEVAPLLTVRQGNEIKQSAIALGTANNIGQSDDIVQLMIYQNGGSIISDPPERLVVFNNSRTKQNSQVFFPGSEALDFYTSFADPAKANYSWNSAMPDAVKAFGEGKTAMLIDYPATREILAKNYPNLRYDNTYIIQISNSQTPVNFGNFSVETVTKAARNGRENLSWAWVLSYLKSSSSQSMTETLKRPSPHKTISIARSKEPLGVLSKQALTVRLPYKRHHEEFDRIFKQMITNVSENGQNPTDAINQAAEEISELIR